MKKNDNSIHDILVLITYANNKGPDRTAHCDSLARAFTAHTHMGLDVRNSAFGFANNKGADQPAHMPSLISTFVVRLLESIISKLATGEISLLLLVSVAEETGLSLDLSKTLKTGFVALRPT